MRLMTILGSAFNPISLFHSPEITQEEAYDVFKKCILEIQKRLIVNLANFKVAVVDKNGIRYLDDITSKSLIDYKP